MISSSLTIEQSTTMSVVLEIESTFKNQTTRDEFDAFVGEHSTALIFHRGIRVRDRVEVKQIKLYKNILKSHRGRMIPIIRTVAEERLCDLNFDLDLYEIQIIKRKYYPDGTRESMIQYVSSNKYVKAYEIEYDKSDTDVEIQDNEYQATFSKECKFYDKEQSMLNHITENITPDIPNNENIINCIPTKLQLTYHFDPEKPYKYMMKWDGYKAKAVFYDDRFMLYGDMKDIKVFPLTDDQRKKVARLTNYILQVEVIEKINMIIFVDIIGCVFQKTMYYTDIDDLEDSLKYMSCVKSMKLDNYKLYVQKVINGSLPSTISNFSDGYIIIQNNMLIKWKIPTFDAQCNGGYNYIIPEPSVAFVYTVPGVFGQIYEFGYKDGGVFLIRSRNDRAFASTTDEYLGYLEAVEQIEKSKCI